jgi:hypothetical protein
MTYVSAAKYISEKGKEEVLIFSDTNWTFVLNDDMDTAFSRPKRKVFYIHDVGVVTATASAGSRVEYERVFSQILRKTHPEDYISKLFHIINLEVSSFGRKEASQHIFMHYLDDTLCMTRAARWVAGKKDVYFRRHDEDVTAIGSGRYSEVKNILRREYRKGCSFEEVYNVLDKAFTVATFLSAQPEDCPHVLEIPYLSAPIIIRVTQKTRDKLKKHSLLSGRVVDNFTEHGLQTLESTLDERSLKK